jgi:hypothetical protein
MQRSLRHPERVSSVREGSPPCCLLRSPCLLPLCARAQRSPGARCTYCSSGGSSRSPSSWAGRRTRMPRRHRCLRSSLRARRHRGPAAPPWRQRPTAPRPSTSPPSLPAPRRPGRVPSASLGLQELPPATGREREVPPGSAWASRARPTGSAAPPGPSGRSVFSLGRSTARPSKSHSPSSAWPPGSPARVTRSRALRTPCAIRRSGRTRQAAPPSPRGSAVRPPRHTAPQRILRTRRTHGRHRAPSFRCLWITPATTPSRVTVASSTPVAHTSRCLRAAYGSHWARPESAPPKLRRPPSGRRTSLYSLTRRVTATPGAAWHGRPARGHVHDPRSCVLSRLYALLHG